MFFVPQGPDFQWYYSNTLNTQPTTAYGTTITPGTLSGEYGSWVQVASSSNISQDVYGVLINLNSNNTSGIARNTLCEMGVDNAGGTSYVTIIPHLIAGSAASYTTAPGGFWYYFPIYIKAGSSVAFRGSSNNSTYAPRANVYFYGQPRRPEALRVGSYVTAIGVDLIGRAGTTLTTGTSSDGAWVQIGTTEKSYWWWQIGLNVGSSSMSAAVIHADLSAGNSATKKILLENQYWSTTTTEQVSCNPLTVNAYNNVASGIEIYGRLQSSASNTSLSMIAYGLGG